MSIMTRFAAAGLVIFLAACSPPTFELSGPTMGTRYTVKVVGLPREVEPAAVRSCVEEVLRGIDEQMSGYRDDSAITTFNDSASTEWMPVPDDLARVVITARSISELSGGAFDLTIAPLVELWGMKGGQTIQRVPEAARIDQLRSEGGYRLLHARIAPPALRKDGPQLRVDLNAIAPGYAVDAIAERFEDLGLRDFMIDIGGEVRAHGRNASDEAWRIAVERPVDGAPEPYAIVSLTDAAVATSGEYRHYTIIDGQRYSHSIDPRTGRPVRHNLASVVVVQPTAAQADAWSTALNVLGEIEGFELAARLGIPAMFIVGTDDSFDYRITDAFRPYLAVAPAQ